MQAYLDAMTASARVIERGGRRVGYLRLWSGVGANVVQAVHDAVRGLNAKGVDGFVLDLRDGWGGVPPELVSVFDPSVPVLVTRTRGGESYAFDAQVRAPAAVLVNEGVRSGKEVIAHALRRHGLATLVGEATAGAMLPGTLFCLDDGALLYLAVGTTTVDGAVLEGHPVQPHVVVPFDVRWSNGRDPQLDAALDVVVKGAR